MGFLSSIGKVVKGVVGSVTGGDILGVAGGLAGSSLTNSASAANAAQANAFTKEQLQNRHQWEVKDLLKAGLNPVLSANAAPSIGHSAMAPVVNPVDSVHSAVNSALASKRLKAELEQMQSATDLNRAGAASHLAEAGLKTADTALVNQSIRTRKPKEDVANLVAEGTAKFSAVANSAAAAARQVPRFITHGLPNLARKRVFSNR